MPYLILSQQTPEQLVRLTKLVDAPYNTALGYPRATPRQLASRVAALRVLGITRVNFVGPLRLGSLDVLGKGYSGVVVVAIWKRRKVALKIRRTDSPRKTMATEARLLALANTVHIGPKLYVHSRDALVMEYIEGTRISEWMSMIPKRSSSKRVRGVLRDILKSCYALDCANLDHGELSMISKHVIIRDNDSAVIIDFESASDSRSVSNVTSATQALVIGASLAINVRALCKIPNRRKIISLLRSYKSSRSDSTFHALLDGLGL